MIRLDVLPVRLAGQLSIAVGVATALMLAFIALFFTIGPPWGSLNDASIALEAILSAALAWVFYPSLRVWSPRGSVFGLFAASLGALIVTAGSALVISGAADYVAASHYMSCGLGLVGLWLVGLCALARQRGALPRPLTLLGLLTGLCMSAGLLALFGILLGLDVQDMQSPSAIGWLVTISGAVGGLGWALLYLIWTLWLGRALLSVKTFTSQQEKLT